MEPLDRNRLAGLAYRTDIYFETAILAQIHSGGDRDSGFACTLI